MEFITRAYYKYWSWLIWNDIDTVTLVAPMVRWDCRALAAEPFNFDDDLVNIFAEHYSDSNPNFLPNNTEKILQLGKVGINLINYTVCSKGEF